jgi:hypothetical protein
LIQTCKTSASKLLTRDMPKRPSDDVGYCLLARRAIRHATSKSVHRVRLGDRPIADLAAQRDPHRLTLVPSVKWRKYLSRIGFLLATI